MASYEQIGQGLAAAISDPGDVPASGRDLVRYAGGRRQLVEQLTGMSGPPKRGAYASEVEFKAAKTRWESATQRVRRYDIGARKSAESLNPEQRRRVRSGAREVKRRRLAETQMRARVRAVVTVPSAGKDGDDTRERDLPSGGPGVLLPVAASREVFSEARDRDYRDAAEAFLPAFFEAYHWDDALDIGVELQVKWIRVWPDGQREPRG